MSMMSDLNKIAVWNKGTTIPNYDAVKWRKDSDGNVISFTEHGNRDSNYGWEIDHIVPVAEGGGDLLANLRPLHWTANVAR